MKKKILVLFLLFFSAAIMYAIGQYSGNKNRLVTHTIYDSTGKPVSFSSMLKELSKADVCLMGEFHNDPIAHWLEIKLLEGFNKTNPGKLVFGGEMWERDQQSITDEYIKEKLIDIDSYKRSSKQWQNFETDYQILLKICYENEIPFYCTNVPRRYANLVSEQGDAVLDKLSDEAKRYLPPLPIAFNFTEKSYVDFLNMLKMEGMHSMKKSSVENLIKAQALKDATMAYWISKLHKEGQLFFHINGDFHSAYRSGINYYLKLYNPTLVTKVISVQYAVEGEALDFSKGDYNIVIDNDIPKSYL